MPSQWTRRRVLQLGSTVGLLGVVGCLGTSERDSQDNVESLPVADARQFSSAGCACCKQYASYLNEHIRGTVSETVPDDETTIKREHGIPEDLWSCHTVVLDEYVVEGHVPVAVIATLFDDKPAIDGIALPGMPRGSPGMSGERDDPFTLYTIGGDAPGSVYTEG